MSINAFIPQGPTLVVAAAGTAPSGSQIQCCGSAIANTLRLFNEDNANVVWYAVGNSAVTAQSLAKFPVGANANMGIPLPPLAVEVIRINLPTPNVYISAITRGSNTANMHVTPGDGL